MAKYLVTGGAGFIGSHLVDRLLVGGHEVDILDNLSNGNLDNVSGYAGRMIADVATFKDFDYATGAYDGIFHLATAPRSSSLSDPQTDIETNCKGMISVLELARADKCKVVFTSNSGIYGAGVDIDETWPNKPTTPYDVDKLAAEYYCKIYHDIYGVKSTILRFATVYGPRQVVNEKLNWRPLVSTFLKNIVNDEPIIINGDGEQTRDLLYVKDAVQALVKAMNSDSNNADIFLISTNTETSVIDVWAEIVRALDKPYSNARMMEPLKGDIRRMKINYSKAHKVLGYEPTYTPANGIKEMIEWHK